MREEEQNDNERLLFNSFLHAIFNYTKDNKVMLTCPPLWINYPNKESCSIK
jgi:hypothetical protein